MLTPRDAVIEVRAPTPADASGLLAVASRWPTERGSTVTPFDEAAGPLHLDEPDFCVRVAVEGDQVLGYAAGCHRNGKGHLEELFVLTEHHRRGAGTMLVRAFEQWAKEVGCDAVELGGTVPGFYFKLGYVRRLVATFVKRLQWGGLR